MRKALNIPLEEFLRPFFGPGERICLRIFDDRKTGTFKGAKLETTLSGLPGLMDTLKKHNEKNRGIYFVVNFGGHEDSEITRINAQFMECDELPLDEQLKQIEAFPLEPSLIVKTRKSLHTYWLIKDGDVTAFRRVQKRLVAQFHGDRSCVNESRVLRLPGFYHYTSQMPYRKGKSMITAFRQCREYSSVPSCLIVSGTQKQKITLRSRENNFVLKRRSRYWRHSGIGWINSAQTKEPVWRKR